jgi:hypothetical protein
MTMDATTDIIAHFIGAFEIPVEAPRLQILYDPFTHVRPPTELAPPEAAPPRELDTAHGLADGAGRADYEPDTSLPPATDPMPAAASGGFVPAPAVAAAGPTGPTSFDAGGAFGLAPATTPVVAPVAAAGATLDAPPPVLPIPGGIATVTAQTNQLADDDVLLAGGDAAFAPVAPLQAELAAAGTLGDVWVEAALGDLAAAAPTPAFAHALSARLDAVVAPPLAGLEATVLRGADARDTVVDGRPAAALPDWRDQLPAALREEADDDATAPAAEAGAEGGAAQAGTAVSGAPVAAAVDETSDDGTSEGTTADGPAGEPPDPFAGMPHDDADAGPGADVEPGHTLVTGTNQAINQVDITYDWLDAPNIVVRGDVFDLDVVVQHNLLRDRDAADGPTAPSTGSATDATPAGASHATNAASINATSRPAAAPEPAGSAAPAPVSAVTRVDGDLSLTNSVQQHNFVTDDDRAEITLTGGASSIGTGGNVTFNEAFFTELGYRFDLIVVDGDMIKLDVINQLNVLLDDDHVTGDDVGSSGGTGSPGVTADNLAMNRAVVAREGVDAHGEIPAAFAAAADQLRAGADELSAELLADARFAGDALITTLHIAGDLVVTNLIDQRSYLGDQDQVHLARDALAAATGGALAITTGANALVNSAAITERGVDSDVMTGGEVYDDALLYQAGLVDTDAQPLDADIPALVNEAVAFLADGFTVPAEPKVPEPPVATDAGAVTADIMQTMLA